jgi:hypothetical protein
MTKLVFLRDYVQTERMDEPICLFTRIYTHHCVNPLDSALESNQFSEYGDVLD